MGRTRRDIQSTNRAPVYQLSAVQTGSALRRPRGIPVWAWLFGFLAGMTCIGICAVTFLTSYVLFCSADPDFRAAVVRRAVGLGRVCDTARGDAVALIPTVDPVYAATESAKAINTRPTEAVGRDATMTPTFRPTATTEPLPTSFRVSNYKWEPQKWNNCGPANTVQGLRLIGYETTQKDAAGYMKPNSNDGNVSPWQISDYVNKTGTVRALVRVNGNMLLLKRLIYAGFGTLVETGLISPDDGTWEGHYLTVIGWNDGQGIFDGLDTLENSPQGVSEEYIDFDYRWSHFNRVYIVLYRPDQESKLRSILGLDWDAGLNTQRALEQALQEAQQDQNNAYAWFNAGSNYVALGQYDQARAMYDRAYSIYKGLPWRMLWYQFGPFKAYYETGQYQRVIELANATLANTTHIEELFYYRGSAYAALGQSAEAQTDLQTAISNNTNFTPAQEFLNALQGGLNAKPRAL